MRPDAEVVVLVDPAQRDVEATDSCVDVPGRTEIPAYQDGKRIAKVSGDHIRPVSRIAHRSADAPQPTGHLGVAHELGSA